MLNVVQIHEKHLHHLDEKLEQMQTLLVDLLESNIWFSSKRNFNCGSTTTKTLSNWHSITDWPQGPCPMTSWMASLHMLSKWQTRKIWYSLCILPQTSFKLRSHIYSTWQQTNLDWFWMSQWSPPTSWTCTSFSCYWFISTLWPTSQWLQTLAPLTSSQSDTPNHFKLFPAQICILAFTSVTPSFARERKWWKLVWKDHV